MQATVCFWHVDRAWGLMVTCATCTDADEPSCNDCKTLFRRAAALERSDGFQTWKQVLRTDQGACLIFGDWLEESGWPELAHQARQTTFEPCRECGWRRRAGLRFKGKVMAPYCEKCNGSGKAPRLPREES